MASDKPAYRDLTPPKDPSRPLGGSERHRPPIPADRQLPPHRSSSRAPWFALGVGALAAAGATLLARASQLGKETPPLYRTLKARPREFAWGEHRITYYERGQKDGTPVVFVHSIHAAASAREVSEPFERLMGDHHVFAYDLLGFGASDRPDVAYDATLYQRLLRDFLGQVVGRPAHVVATSVSAAHAVGVAASDPELFASLVMVNPTGLLTQAESQGTRGRLLESLFRLPVIGEGLYNLLVSRPSLEYYGKKTFAHPESETARQLREHEYTTAHQRGARYAPAAFIGDALATNVYMALRTLTVPALSVWTDHNGYRSTEAERQAFAGVAPTVEQARISDCGALPMDERPEELEQALRRWISDQD
jgi:pimeloyl-ACP methyl ester carboxylesterase